MPSTTLCCNIYHTILLMAISCEGQGESPTPHPKGISNDTRLLPPTPAQKVAHARDRDPQTDPCGHLALCFSPVKQTDYCNTYHTQSCF